VDEKEFFERRLNKVAKTKGKAKTKSFKVDRKLARERKQFKQRGY
jgi:hypothetical protein